MKKLNLLLIFLVLTSNLFAVVYSTVASGDWHVASNWNANGIPPSPLPSGSSIVINNTLTLSTSFVNNGDSIYGAGNLHIVKGGNLTNNTIISLSGFISLNGNGNSNLGNGGVFTNNQNGTVNIGSLSALHSATVFNNYSNKKGITINGDLSLQFTQTARFVNHSTGFINVIGTFSTESNTNFTNNGVIYANIMDFDANTSTINDGTLYAKSSFTVANGNASNFSSPSGTGSIYSDGPTYLGSGNFTNMFFCNSNGSSPADADNDPTDDGITDSLLNLNNGNNSICNQNNPIPLPIKIFDITYLNGIVELQWSSDNPRKVEYFIIQKSRDGLFWINIDTIFSNPNNFYTYIDTNPHINISYYRIVEVTDNYQYYNAIGIIEFDDKEILLYPNPVTNILIVETETYGGCFELYNLNAELLLKVVFQKDVLHVNMSNIDNGMYYVIITNDLGVKKIRKIIKK